MTRNRYPWSARKHQHDIEYRRNWTRNRMDEMEIGTGEWNKMHDMYYRLTRLLSEVYGTADNHGVAWLTGKDLNLARECVAWAAVVRGGANENHAR